MEKETATVCCHVSRKTHNQHPAIKLVAMSANPREFQHEQRFLEFVQLTLQRHQELTDQMVEKISVES
jgi:hypothetical protein